MGTVYGDRWEVEQSLSEGGQAHTFLVQDHEESGEERYVLKRLKRTDPQGIGRFRNEVEAIENLNHPNVVELIDHDLGAEKPYLVMEHCAGGTLADSTPFWRGSPTQTLHLFEDVLAGVAHAHRQDVVHRDIKPGNIFLRSDDGPAVVGDFGLCLLEQASRKTQTGEAVGAFRYMAPEFEDGRLDNPSPKADVYSLGKLLYWMFRGEVFSREKHREHQWDLRKHNLDTPTGWEHPHLEHINMLLDLMIQEDPDDRRSLANIRALVSKKKPLLANQKHPLREDMQQLCDFCGQGYYVTKAQDPNSVRQFGFDPVSESNWRIVACNVCGHVQAFRLDHTERPGWYEAPFEA